MNCLLQLTILTVISFSLADANFQCPYDGMFENIYDRNSFWHCASGQAFLKRCGSSQIWSQVHQVCVWDTMSQATSTVVSTTSFPIITSTTPPSTMIMFPPQCNNYAYILDGTRHVSNSNLVAERDGSLFRRGPAWVRFDGASGTRLANFPVPSGRCGSEITGWVQNAIDPALGRTVDQTVCFNWSQYNCLTSTQVAVTNCGNYLVYYLPPPMLTDARYCTM